MGNRVFLNKQFSNYLGEQRAILDIIDRFEPGITPSPSVTPTNTPTPSVTPTFTPTPSVTVSPTLTSTPTPTPSSVPSGFNIGSGFDVTIGSIIQDSSTGYFVAGPNFYKSTFRNRIFHLNSDGVLQTDYQMGAFTSNNPINYVGMMMDGTDIVLFANTTYSPTNRSFLNKFDSSGNSVTSFSGTAPNDTVTNVKKLSGGDYIMVGGFTSIGGGASSRIARTSPNCVRDSTFTTNIGTGFPAASTLPALYRFSDDTFLVGGSFTTFNGTGPARMIKLDSNGNRVTAFNTEVTNKFTTGVIQAIDYDVTGDTIYAGGTFTYVTGATTYTRVVALNGDGSLKSSFVTGTGANNTIRDLKWDPVTNRLYLLGQFTAYSGATVWGFCRLLPNGSLDTTYMSTIGDGFRFNDIPNTTFISVSPYSLHIDSNGDVLIVGAFTNFDNDPVGPPTNYNRIIKLDKNGNVITTT
jgi:hypothetical protein